MKRILLFLIVVFLAAAYPGCIHDQIIKNRKLIPVNDTQTTRRLQSLPFGPIRFHLVYNTT